MILPGPYGHHRQKQSVLKCLYYAYNYVDITYIVVKLDFCPKRMLDYEEQPLVRQ